MSLLYINGTLKAVINTHTYLLPGGTNNFYKHKNVTNIKNVLNKEFANICDWFLENKLSIHFGEAKTKCILSV